jgi:tetratricopeptide (TPR) repeat protein
MITTRVLMGIALAATFVVAGASAQSDATKKKNTQQSEPTSATSRTSVDGVPLRDQIDAAPNGPERIRLQLQLADELVAAGKKPEAIAELLLVTGTDVFDPQDLYNAGNALARLGDSEGAITAYRKAIDQRKGKYSRALNNLGVVLLREGHWEEAHEALSSALKLENFRYAEASYNLGRLYSALGQTDLAVREWRRVIAIAPEHLGAIQALGRAGGEGRIVIAPGLAAKGSSLQKENKSAPGDGATHAAATPQSLAVDTVGFGFLQRARSSFEHGNLQDAVANYQRLISRMGGYFPPANLELSYALVTLKRNDEALANLLLVANRDGARYPITYYYVARLYEFRGELRLAEQSFAKASTAYGATNRQFLLDLSRVRERQGDFKGALAAMEEFVAALEQQGRKPSWADERLTALRQKLQ